MKKMRIAGGRESRGTWCHGSAAQLERILADVEKVSGTALKAAGDVGSQCEVCRTFDMAPSRPIAGVSTISALYSRVWADLLFLGGGVVLHVMDPYSEDSLLAQVAP